MSTFFTKSTTEFFQMMSASVGEEFTFEFNGKKVTATLVSAFLADDHSILSWDDNKPSEFDTIFAARSSAINSMNPFKPNLN